MPFTQTPVNDTYSTEKVTLIHDLDFAPAGTDVSSLIGGMVNILPFKDASGNLYGETRYSIQAESITFSVDANHVGMSPPLTGAIVRGLHIWEQDQDFFMYLVIIDDSNGSSLYYKFYPDTGPGHPFGWMQMQNTTDATMHLHTSLRTPVRFCDYVDATNGRFLVFSDGVDLYRVSAASTSYTRCLDADMPTPHLPFPIYMDGYIFLAKGASFPSVTGYADIYNSDLNNPMSWTAGSFVSAQMYADRLKALVRINNYICAIGQDSCEFFYDAGNATGSPLARYESGALPFGCVHPNTIAYMNDKIMMLASNGWGEQSFAFIHGFKHELIEAPAVLPLLQNQLNSGTTDYTKLRAGFFVQNSQLFYFIQFNGTQVDTTWTTESFVYSMECKIWVRMRSDIYSIVQPNGSVGWPVLFTHNSTSRFPYTFFAGQLSNNAKVIFGHLDPVVRYDQVDQFNLYDIYQELNIPRWNAGTMNRKFMSRLCVNYIAKPGGDNTITANGMTVQYSDDQGSTWTTAYPHGNRANDYPFYLQLGTFRERMFKIVNCSTRYRFLNIEVDINKGQQ